MSFNDVSVGKKKHC